LPDGVTEESIKQGISVPRNKLLFENAKDILPYTGIGSGIMRAMQSYDKISFKNDFVREEFITTLKRDEIPDEMVVDTANFGVNENTPKKYTEDFGVNERVNNEDGGINLINERVKPENKGINVGFEEINKGNEAINKGDDGIKLAFEGINEGINLDLGKILSYLKNNPLSKHSDIKQIIVRSDATVERYLKILKDNGIIEYVGAKKTGGYRIKQ
jgi:ATP-dependent DNA helicase RecG